jgi:hypothetical protein
MTPEPNSLNTEKPTTSTTTKSTTTSTPTTPLVSQGRKRMPWDQDPPSSTSSTPTPPEPEANAADGSNAAKKLMSGLFRESSGSAKRAGSIQGPIDRILTNFGKRRHIKRTPGAAVTERDNSIRPIWHMRPADLESIAAPLSRILARRLPDNDHGDIADVFEVGLGVQGYYLDNAAAEAQLDPGALDAARNQAETNNAPRPKRTKKETAASV